MVGQYGISRDRKYRKSLLGLAASSRPTPIHGRAVMENGEVDKLRESIETIWSTMLGMEVAPGVEMATNRNQPSFLTGCIQIDRRLEWRGLRGLLGQAREIDDRAEPHIFGVEFDQTTPDQEVIDALGELVNIVSGNFKSFLPEPSQLSLPSVAEGTGTISSRGREPSTGQAHLHVPGRALPDHDRRGDEMTRASAGDRGTGRTRRSSQPVGQDATSVDCGTSACSRRPSSSWSRFHNLVPRQVTWPVGQAHLQSRIRM